MASRLKEHFSFRLRSKELWSPYKSKALLDSVISTSLVSNTSPDWYLVKKNLSLLIRPESKQRYMDKLSRSESVKVNSHQKSFDVLVQLYQNIRTVFCLRVTARFSEIKNKSVLSSDFSHSILAGSGTTKKIYMRSQPRLSASSNPESHRKFFVKVFTQYSLIGYQHTLCRVHSLITNSFAKIKPTFLKLKDSSRRNPFCSKYNTERYGLFSRVKKRNLGLFKWRVKTQLRFFLKKRRKRWYRRSGKRRA